MELASRPGNTPSWDSPSDSTRTDRWCTSRSFAPTLHASMHCLRSQHRHVTVCTSSMAICWHPGIVTCRIVMYQTAKCPTVMAPQHSP